MFLALQVSYAVVCILFAWLNARVIKEDRPIYHGINAGFHISLLTLMYLKSGDLLIICCGALIARVFFDWPLDLFRGLSLGYVPEKPKSLIDRLEKLIYGNKGVMPKLIYLFLLILFNLLHYKIIYF